MRAVWLTAIVLLFVSVGRGAQDKSVQLSQIEDKLVRSVDEQMPDWKHKAVTPMQGSTDVAINQWVLDKNALGVTIIRYPSEEGAVKGIRQFAIDMRARGEIPEAGEEQYALTAANSSIVFRIGQFTVYVDVRSSDRDNEKQLLKKIARLVSDAIKN